MSLLDDLRAFRRPVSALDVLRIIHGGRFDAALAAHARANAQHWQSDHDRPASRPNIEKAFYEAVSDAGSRLNALVDQGDAASAGSTDPIGYPLFTMVSA